MDAEAVYSYMGSNSTTGSSLLDKLLDKEGLYASSGLSSQLKTHVVKRMYPSPDVSSDSYKEFVKFCKSDPPARLDLENVDGLTDENIFAIGTARKENFLDFDRFLQFSFSYTRNSFEGLKKLDKDVVDKNLFVSVEETIHRWVPAGNSAYATHTGKAIKSIIDNCVIPELKKEGKISEIPFYDSISSLSNETSCGFNRSTSITVLIPKDEFLSRKESYHNLIYTCAIHCGRGHIYDKVARKRHCPGHRLGRLNDGKHDLPGVCRENWIPIDYGRQLPGNVLAEVKPIITSTTSVRLRAGQLAASFTAYLTAKSVMINPSYTSLSEAVQSFLIAKYKDASKIPSSLIQKLIGLSFEDAAKVVFETKATKSVPDGKKDQTPGSGKSSKGDLMSKYSKNAQKSIRAAFGCKENKDVYSKFMKLKAKHKLKGNLNLEKLSKYFKDGKPEFGKKSAKEISSSCLN